MTTLEDPNGTGPDAADLVEPPALSAIQGANPFVGMSRGQVLAALGRWSRHLLANPVLVASRASQVAAEDLRILAGMSNVEPDPKDRRFADPAWTHPLWRRLEQAYLSRRQTLLRTVEDLDLDAKSAERARFGLMQIAEAAAPTNNLATNPAALKRLRETRGRSLVDGMRHMAWDARYNGGLPSQVDTRPFTLGENIAATPGAVVERAPEYELIQYRPTTERVQRRPVVVVSPQVNKYYFLDMAPGRSFVEHAVGRGLQTFMVSWRNATPECRDWTVDSYVAALRRALETACEVTGSDDAMAIGFCAGGLTLAMLNAHLAQIGDPLLAASALAVAMVDTEAKSSLNAFLTERSAAVSIARSKRKGVLDGRRLAQVFAWVRPNDLVWNYWVANYLLGQSPPAFDVLAWNSDTTDLPAGLHAGFVRLMLDNALMKRGAFDVLGTPVDLSAADNDLYLVGAANDHLVPWQSVYATTQVHAGRSRFALSNSGHIQALINPPGNPKATYAVGDEHPADPQAWLASAERRSGSWWTDWADWAVARGGGEVDAPAQLGSDAHPVLCAAPGTYVLDDRRPGSRAQPAPMPPSPPPTAAGRRAARSAAAAGSRRSRAASSAEGSRSGLTQATSRRASGATTKAATPTVGADGPKANGSRTNGSKANGSKANGSRTNGSMANGSKANGSKVNGARARRTRTDGVPGDAGSDGAAAAAAPEEVSGQAGEAESAPRQRRGPRQPAGS